MRQKTPMMGVACSVVWTAAITLCLSLGPQQISAQLSEGGLAPPAKAGGKAAGAPPSSAEIVGSSTGASLDEVSVGDIDITNAGKGAGTVVKPPRSPPKIVIPRSPAPPKAPAAGPLATCVFDVQGNAPKTPGKGVPANSANSSPVGKADIRCSGPGAPLTLYGADQERSSFETQLTGVKYLTNTLGGPRPVLFFNKVNVRIRDSSFAYIVGAPYTLVFNDSNVQIDNTNFIGNTGTPEGAIHGFGSFFNITNSNFTSNVGRQTGVITIEDGSASFTGCTFTRNTGLEANAGAVVIGRGSTASFTGSIFTSNRGSAGGAILAYQGSNLTVTQSTFAGNVATNNGGAIQQLGGGIDISSSFFDRNVAQSIGGAYFGGDVVGTIADTNFANNTARTGQGGGVYILTGKVDVSNSRFTGNSGQAGGGFYSGINDGDIDECSFEENIATNSGGGISQQAGSGNVTSSIFIGNRAENLGGGLYQSNQTGGVSTCLFSANVATLAFSGQGAGIFRNGMNGDVQNIFFEDNEAALNGGGLYMIASIGNVQNSTFLSNAATSGAAVYAFNCAGRINSNALVNEPLDAVAIDHSIGFTEESLTTGRIDAPVIGLEGDGEASAEAEVAALGPDETGLGSL